MTTFLLCGDLELRIRVSMAFLHSPARVLSPSVESLFGSKVEA